MTSIINIEDYKIDPHMTGEAHCIACKHEWVAVVAIGATWLQCPECGTLKGLLKYSCQREEPEWKCGCGNKLFTVNPDGIYCPNCGEIQHGF